SQIAMKDANIESVLNLEKNLQSYGRSLSEIPHVIQANKRDLEDVLSMEEIDSLLNHYGAAVTEAAASDGDGVLGTLTEIVRHVMRELREQFASGSTILPGPSKRPAHEPAAASPPLEAEQAGPEPDEVPEAHAAPEGIKGTGYRDESGHEPDASDEDVEEMELEPAPAPGPEAPTETDKLPDAGQGPVPESGPGISAGEAGDDEAPERSEPAAEVEADEPVKVLVPLEGLGTLELLISIRARVLEKGEMRSVNVDVSGAVRDGLVHAAASSPGETGRDKKNGGEQGSAQSVEKVPEVKPPLSGENTEGSKDNVIEAPEPVLDLEPDPEPEPQPLANPGTKEGRYRAEGTLPPLGEPSDQPLGAPLDGQDMDEMDLPDLPGEEEKILLDDDLEPAASLKSSPDPSPDYDPSAQPLDFDFPETGPEVDKPKKRGLFGLRKKK
ncbi:MAG: hypothetical protein PVJ01_06370, partial [Pseudomonadota bacterium]